jgi:thiol-disulfide isomerase/thioredoxin
MRILLLALMVILAVGCDRKAAAPGGAADATTSPSTVLPPIANRAQGGDFAGATAWLNAERPLVPADLAGRVVVVDFWTSCCINCLHMHADHENGVCRERERAPSLGDRRELDHASRCRRRVDEDLDGMEGTGLADGARPRCEGPDRLAPLR